MKKLNWQNFLILGLAILSFALMFLPINLYNNSYITESEFNNTKNSIELLKSIAIFVFNPAILLARAKLNPFKYTIFHLALYFCYFWLFISAIFVKAEFSDEFYLYNRIFIIITALIAAGIYCKNYLSTPKEEVQSESE